LRFPVYGSLTTAMILESIEKLPLAAGTVVGSPAADDHPADGRSTDQAWLTGAEIDAVLELEKAFDTRRIHVVGNGRSAERDRLPKDGLQAGVQAVELGSLQVASHPAGAYAGAKEALVGVDVADSVEKLLIEQGRLDGCAPVPEERGKLIARDAERFVTGTGETRCLGSGERMQLHTAEAPGIHKTEFPP
jgi:hypothetical protein